jgi:hemolysin D
MLQKKFSSAIERGFAPAVTDFAPGLLAIQESPPARLPRAILYSVGVLFAILFVWAVFGQLDIIASAEGRLVPKSYTKIVQPAEAGIVTKILVRDGQEVVAGQVLLRMDATTATADLNSLSTESAFKNLTLRRIDAELTNKSFMPASSDPAELFSKVAAQYRARRQALADAIAQERAVLDKARFDLIASEQVLEKLRVTVPLYQQTAESYGKLVQQGFVSELGAKDKIREKVEKEQDLKAHQATVQALQAAITQSQKRLAQINSNYISQLTSDRAEVQSDAQKTDAALTKQQYKSGLLELRAPQAGVVKDLAIYTPGTVVQPGAVLLNIVPQQESLVAEVAISNEDVGFVQPGQTVKVKLASYPFQKYGMVEGKVEHVSADSNMPNNQQTSTTPPLTYKAIVALNTQTLAVAGNQPLKLSAGMAVVAEIHQGRRTVMEFLLSPVQKVAQEAARER